MQILLIAVGIYLLYRFIFGFVIPVANTTSQVKKQFRAMKEQMEETHQQNNSCKETWTKHYSSKQKTTSGKPGSREDYIEFEEVIK